MLYFVSLAAGSVSMVLTEMWRIKEDYPYGQNNTFDEDILGLL